MGTLFAVKARMKLDKGLRRMMVRGGRNEILLDLDGDKQADIAIVDMDQDGDIDAIAADLTGDGDFNLFVADTDANGIPDAVLADEEGTGELKVIALGPEVEESAIAAARAIKELVEAAEYVEGEIEAALADFEKIIRAARRELQKA